MKALGVLLRKLVATSSREMMSFLVLFRRRECFRRRSRLPTYLSFLGPHGVVCLSERLDGARGNGWVSSCCLRALDGLLPASRSGGLHSIMPPSPYNGPQMSPYGGPQVPSAALIGGMAPLTPEMHPGSLMNYQLVSEGLVGCVWREGSKGLGDCRRDWSIAPAFVSLDAVVAMVGGWEIGSRAFPRAFPIRSSVRSFSSQ